jgi:hypothetical protein
MTLEASAFSLAGRDPRLINLLQTKRSVSTVKKILTRLNHPFVAPSLEFVVKQLAEQVYVFVLRPFYPSGSLRDAVYGVRSPSASACVWSCTYTFVYDYVWFGDQAARVLVAKCGDRDAFMLHDCKP